MSYARTTLARRPFLKSMLLAIPGGFAAHAVRDAGRAAHAVTAESPAGGHFFRTRGIVITPADLTLADWPERARAAGLTTIALHPTPALVERFIGTDAGQAFLERCRAAGLDVEYELHAMGDLLPRSLFEKDPGLFRMDERGERLREGNLCVHSGHALDIVVENALRIGRTLKPTTGRYFYWSDDGVAFCRCPKCRDLSDSEQALIVENRLVGELRKLDVNAQLAHLAYARTMPAPQKVKPADGVFLEFAPIARRYDVPYARQTNPATDRDRLDALDENLRVFRPDTAQALEYWLDVSMFSRWRRPAVKLPFIPEHFRDDLSAYGIRGIRHITSFAVYIDADYVARYGPPPLAVYGEALAAWRPGAPR